MLKPRNRKRTGVVMFVRCVSETHEDGSTKFSEDFIRRMEAWEKMKGTLHTFFLTCCYTVNRNLIKEHVEFYLNEGMDA